MKKILYITTVSGTINAFLIPHIKMLLEMGYRVDCACNINNPIKKELIDMGVEIFEIDFQRNPFNKLNINAIKQIKKLQSDMDYDIIHVHTPVASIISRYALRKFKNTKVIYTCHGFHFYKGGSIKNWLLFYPIEKIAARWTDTIITINNEDYKIAKKFKQRNKGRVYQINGVGIDKKEYILNDFDKKEFRKTLELENDDFVILVLAEINENKNHIQLIEALNVVNKKHKNIKAVFAGEALLKDEIMKTIKKYNLDDNIKILGLRNDVNKLINMSDIVVLVSKREGLGKCLLEAMVCKKTVIATNTRGPRQFVRHNENGFLVGINNIDETVNAIYKLYEDRYTKEKFEDEAIKTSNEYLLENILKQLKKVYIDL